MFDTEEELLRQIWLGEDSTLELKEIFFSGNRIKGPNKDDMADELAAFANSKSGVVVLGVNDKSREIIGISLDKMDLVEGWIREICRDVIKPSMHYHLRKIMLPSTNGDMVPVIRIDVPRSLFVHKSPGGYWRREGSSKREMQPDVLARLFQQRNQARLIRFDEYTVSSCSTDVLKKDKWNRYRTPLSPVDDVEFLSKMKLIAKDDNGILRPTVSGVLVACDKPDEYLPNAYIQAVCYRGKERNGNYQIDAKDITGSIDEQVREGCKFVEKNMKTYAVKIPQRNDIPQYAMNAVFEALVNAVAHRDYSIEGSKIRLHLFADRLELYSPGTIPNTLTIDSLALRQVSRNETLTGLLAKTPVELGYQAISRDFMMDKRGEGVPIIISASEKLSGRKPEYRLIDDSELVLTIYAAELPELK